VALPLKDLLYLSATGYYKMSSDTENIRSLPSPWPQRCQALLVSLFCPPRRVYGGRNALAQIWHGSATEDSAIWMGNNRPFFEGPELPPSLDDHDFTASQAWFHVHDLERLACDRGTGKALCTLSAIEDLLTVVLLHVLKPAVRHLAVTSLALRWDANAREVVSKYFATNPLKEEDDHNAMIADWAECLVFGGVVSVGDNEARYRQDCFI